MQQFLDNFPTPGARDANAPTATDYVDVRVLAANASETYQLPAGAKFVNFSADGDFYAKFGTNSGVTAAIPAADVVDGSASVLNPGTRRVTGFTHVALIASAARVVTLEVWS